MKLNPFDVQVETYVATYSGFGLSRIGVKLTHTPTGITVKSYTERSAHANLQRAWEMLTAAVEGHGQQELFE